MHDIIQLLILILLQVVLGVDNLLYITLAAKKVEEPYRKKTIVYGTLLAILARIGLLFLLIKLIDLFKDPFFQISQEYLKIDMSIHSLIVLLGGGFILYTSIKEIWHMLSPEIDEQKVVKAKTNKIILSIVLMNLVFSFDSILSAIALTDVLWVMFVAIIFSGLMMIWLANKVSAFLNKNRIFEVGGMFVLSLVGILLLFEGAHLSNLEIFGHLLHPMSKANFYFILAILVIVFIVNNKFNNKIVKGMKFNYRKKAEKIVGKVWSSDDREDAIDEVEEILKK